MVLRHLRQLYHLRICQEVYRIKRDEKKGKDYPNSADIGNDNSIKIAWGLFERLGCEKNYEDLSGQSAGGRFERISMAFLESSFNLLNHLRPGNWIYSTSNTTISNYSQYRHLADFGKILMKIKKELTSIPEIDSLINLDYLVSPDIIVARYPVSDDEININEKVIESQEVATLTSLREANYQNVYPILHASISCKWTIRSDRSQNTRTEALNLIRNRKGKLPHIVVVTGEPLPTRIASLASGTGDLDCVYHFALYELRDSIQNLKNQDQLETLMRLIENQRLRDISDLPFDLVD